MKIVYLIAGLYRKAGMERVISMKANALARSGSEVLIVTTDQKGRDNAFPLDESIRTADLAIGYEDNNGASFADKLLKYPFKQLRHRRLLSQLLYSERPDITVSTFCPEASFLTGIKDGSKKVLEAHFSRYKRLQYGRKGFWALADRLRCRSDERIAAMFDRFVVLTREDAAYWGEKPNLRVIPNPISPDFERSSLENHQIIAIGRYTRQKGFDMLLEAWKMLPENDWTLRIAGSGEECPEGERVITGPSDDIASELLESSIFVLSSRYEGLPMALLEARAAGLPSVCFTCKCGPRDVVRNGVDGILKDEGDVKGLSSAMYELMMDTGLRKSMGEAAAQASSEYGLERIMEQWKTLFEELS